MRAVTGRTYRAVTGRTYRAVTGRAYRAVTGRAYRAVTGRAVTAMTHKGLRHAGRLAASWLWCRCLVCYLLQVHPVPAVDCAILSLNVVGSPTAADDCGSAPLLLAMRVWLHDNSIAFFQGW